ncbi:polysaccharide deacetylase family protein [Zunongwangia sp. H14]|uniref:polysaccharide deacetylase family protein n=1 Tax=Zunongwangia sp. H14 TaxID=3240792 RepID=UPI003568EA30
MAYKESGHFVISLDFELLWGVFDLVDIEEKRNYFEKTRLVIPKILHAFEQNNIHATWAVVGMLFNKNWQEWEKNIPESLPLYNNPKLSAYRYAKNLGATGHEALVFAPEIIKEIINVNGQEVGTHTYSHYYCLEQGQTPVQFKADLEQAVKLARELNITLRSLVFPRNQLKQEYLEICFQLGIRNVRSNPSSWYWQDTQSTSIFTKTSRSGDAYFPLGNKTYPFSGLKKKPGMPVEQKASRFFRPVEENSFLRNLKLKRIKREMAYAAKNNKIYHLWWHPHNFGDRPEESIQDLKLVLEHFSMLQKKYNFQSSNMEEIGIL